jgi:hypothetical protein
MTTLFLLASSILPAIISITCMYIKRKEFRRCFKGKLFILVYVVGALSFFPVLNFFIAFMFAVHVWITER